MKKILAIAGAVLVGSTLTACGGDSGGAYCDDLKKAQSTFSDIEGGDVAGLESAFSTFHDLAAEAPSAIESDWKTLDDGITGAEKALSDAGIKLSDFEDIQAGKLPEGVDATKLQDVATAFQGLSDEKFSEAANAIQKHAKDECNVELS